MVMKVLQGAGAFKFASWNLKRRYSRRMIPRYIRKHGIDMSEFEGQRYRSFADFFARKRAAVAFEQESNVLASPCDGLLSIYPITKNLNMPMKGSHYRLSDLIPVRSIAEKYQDGVCLVFRLQASDYHHFCAFDDARIKETNFIKGKLHSVQPIACEKVPVYRLNRRWWSILETENFGEVIQVEVGAMMVGGVTFVKSRGYLSRGDEMGNFELAGSTIILLMKSDVKKRLEYTEKFQAAMDGRKEIPVSMGERIGQLL